METLAGWDWVIHPTMMLNTAVAKANIQRMAAKAERLGLGFRPHFKTHQSADVGEWFREQGVRAITVSSIEMARYFADAGWEDITIAFPINVRALPEVNALAGRVTLGILVSDATVLPILEKGLRTQVQAWLEIDTGDHRSGFKWDDSAGMVSALHALQALPQLRFKGLLGHGGFTYGAQGLDTLHGIHQVDIERLRWAKAAVEDAGIHGFHVSTGDTPACSKEEDYAGVDEIRPGNFVFYDVQQQQIGSCGFEHIAVALACPVVAVYPERNEAILHGGGVHLGKDWLVDGAYGKLYGRVCLPKAGGWEMPEMGCYLRSISQEHGVAVLRPDLVATLRVGDLLAVLPIHSCMSADLMKRLHAVDGPDPKRPILMMKATQTS